MIERKRKQRKRKRKRKEGDACAALDIRIRWDTTARTRHARGANAPPILAGGRTPHPDKRREEPKEDTQMARKAPASHSDGSGAEVDARAHRTLRKKVRRRRDERSGGRLLHRSQESQERCGPEKEEGKDGGATQQERAEKENKKTDEYSHIPLHHPRRAPIVHPRPLPLELRPREHFPQLDVCAAAVTCSSLSSAKTRFSRAVEEAAFDPDPPPSKWPVTAKILVSVDDLRAILSEQQEPSVAANEPPAQSPRFILTRAATKKELAAPATFPSIPPDASLVTPPKSLSPQPSPARSTAPHRPAAQLRVFAEQSPAASKNAFSALADASNTEKQAAFVALKDDALAAASLDELAKAFRELTGLIRDYRKSAPTAACLDALDAFQSRLDAHHEFPREAESSESFSALLTKSLAAPLQMMTAQLQTQHQAIQSLSKSVDSVKTAHVLTKSYASATGPTPSTASAPPKPKTAPITSTPDERILLRCDGNTPPLFSLPYHVLVPKVNAFLAPLGLPKVACASRSKDGGLFLVPDSKEAVLALANAWSTWGPELFPGSRIVPPARRQN
ncbi:hypothetical protein FB451DRAFT_1178905 [Mycena latifolia]|nr:hypothetical protein FB451DRAFT_1178905 [Mycena latifolia]